MFALTTACRWEFAENRLPGYITYRVVKTINIIIIIIKCIHNTLFVLINIIFYNTFFLNVYCIFIIIFNLVHLIRSCRIYWHYFDYARQSKSNYYRYTHNEMYSDVDVRWSENGFSVVDLLTHYTKFIIVFFLS